MTVLYCERCACRIKQAAEWFQRQNLALPDEGGASWRYVELGTTQGAAFSLCPSCASLVAREIYARKRAVTPSEGDS